MAQASGSQKALAYITEVTFGSTPATPNLTLIPFLSGGFDNKIDYAEDKSINPHRQQTTITAGNTHATGTTKSNFSATNFNEFLESLLGNTWATNVLKVGNTRKSFSIEEGYSDIAQYIVTRGAVVDKATFKFPSQGYCTADFSFIAKSRSAFSGTTIDTNSAYTAATVEAPFVHSNASGFLKEGGSTLGYATDIEFTIENKNSANFAWGTNTMRDMTVGQFELTGKMSVYFEDATLYNKYINSTDSSIDVKLSDGTHSLQFFMPKIKFIDAKMSDGEGPVMIDMPFRAMYNTSDASSLVITRA